MKIKSLEIKKYKILENFKVDFADEANLNVIIGKNGAGKTTFFEAIVLIFRELSLTDSASDLKSRFKSLDLHFEISYTCNGFEIIFRSIISDKEEHDLFFRVNNKDFPLNKANLKAPKGKDNDPSLRPVFKYVPDHIVTYYSGESERVTSLFKGHLETASNSLQKGQDIPLREFINIDSNSVRKVLISLLPFTDAKKADSIGKLLSLDKIHSIRLKFKRPLWYAIAKKNFEKAYAKNSEDALYQFNQDFYFAEGEVGRFLGHLTEFSEKTLDPSTNFVSDIVITPSDAIDYFSDVDRTEFASSLDFFKMLDHTAHSDLIQSIKLEIEIENKIIEFEDLSEGEHQIRLVLGLSEIFRNKETLFLFDEPDTYLYPGWQRGLMEALNIVDACIIMSTHSPQVLSKVNSQNILVFDKGLAHPIDSPTLNRDTNSILEEIFDITVRPPEADKIIHEIFDLISRNELDDTNKRIKELRRLLDSQDPVFLKISATINRKKLLGK